MMIAMLFSLIGAFSGYFLKILIMVSIYEDIGKAEALLRD